MKRVLFVAYFFPPIAATGAMRPLNFCRHLPAYGWRPRVVATDHASALPRQPSDEDLLKKIPAGIDVLRVPHNNNLARFIDVRDRVYRAVHPWFHSDAGVSHERSDDQSDHSGSVSVVKAFGRLAADYLFSFPDPQCHWIRPVMKAIPAFLAQEPPLVVWATGAPWTSLLVGKQVAEKYNIPFIADFRDPWTGGYQFFSSKLLHRRTESLERSVCAAASRVVLNTDELKARFCSVYPNWWYKFVTITNGYAEELVRPHTLPEAPIGMAAKPATKNAPLKLCHFGTVYGNRNPIALFRAVLELLNQGTINATELELQFIGAWDINDGECHELVKRLEEKGVLRRSPPIPHQQCLKAMIRSDVLLILQPDYPMQIPAKLYEYIVAGRPLLVLGGEGATADLVHRNRLGRCCRNRVEDVKRLLISILADRTALKAPNPLDIERFSYRTLSRQLAGLLDSVIAEKAR